MTIHILFIFVIFLVLLYTWNLVFMLQKKVKEEKKRTKESIGKDFQSLRKKIEKQVEMLDGEPGLSKEEEKIRDALYAILEESEKKIKKEIK